MSPRLLFLVALAAIAFPAHGQAVTGKAQTELLTTARARYYNLSLLGVNSFSCNVDVDWDSIFTQINRSALPPDSPLMVYLAKSRLGVKETVASGAAVTWANTGTPPDSVAASAGQLRGAIKQMLEGYFEAWTPSINGRLFSKDVTGVTATATGYLITDTNPDKSSDTLTFDKAMLLSHVSNISAEQTSEYDMKYLKTPQGWLLSALDGDTRQLPSGPATHVTTQSEYQTVEGFQLPAAISLTVKNVATFKLKLSGCTVEKQAK
jgi:hypothetical protein